MLKPPYLQCRANPASIGTGRARRSCVALECGSPCARRRANSLLCYPGLFQRLLTRTEAQGRCHRAWSPGGARQTWAPASRPCWSQTPARPRSATDPGRPGSHGATPPSGDWQGRTGHTYRGSSSSGGDLIRSGGWLRRVPVTDARGLLPENRGCLGERGDAEEEVGVLAPAPAAADRRARGNVQRCQKRAVRQGPDLQLILRVLHVAGDKSAGPGQGEAEGQDVAGVLG